MGRALNWLMLLVATLAAIGWLWLFYWLRCVCPVAFWTLDLLLLALGPVLWVAWRRLWKEWKNVA